MPGFFELRASLKRYTTAKILTEVGEKTPPQRIKNAFQLLQRLVDIMRAHANEQAAGLANLVLRVALDIETLDFSKVQQTIREGELCAAADSIADLSQEAADLIAGMTSSGLSTNVHISRWRGCMNFSWTHFSSIC